MLLTSVIRAHLGSLFPGREVEAFSQFRITRDSDLEVDADVTNLRQALRSGLTTRHFGQAVRLEVVNTCPAELSAVPAPAVRPRRVGAVPVNGPVNLVRLNELIDLADAPTLRFPPFEPAWPATLPRQQSMFERMRHGDAAAAPAVRVVRAGDPVPARGGARPGRAGDQADDLSRRQRLAADGPADRGGQARQGSDGGGRAEGALRGGGQHQLGRAARGGRRAGRLRRRRPEDARQAAARDPARGRAA